MDARLGRIDAVIADVIAEEHVLEIKYYCAGHEPEAQHFVAQIARLQHIRTLLARMPFSANVQDTLCWCRAESSSPRCVTPYNRT